MKLLAKIFIEKDKAYSFGPGRVDLLRSVDKLGSLRQAAIEHGMSYRWAWGKLRESEKQLGVDLLVRAKSSAGGRPNVLTAEARILLDWYEKTETEVQRVLLEAEKNMPACLKLQA